MFDKLLRENIGFFADRHSSEFIARLTTGAAAVSSVINLLITALGRDLLSLIGLVTVMVIQDPVMSLFGFVGGAAGVLRSAQIDPPGARHRARPVHRRHADHRDLAGNAARHPHRQGLHARRRMRERFDSSVAAVEHEFQQDGARLQPRQPDDGNARRLRHRDGHHLRRLSRDRNRRHAGRVLLLHRRFPARLRAGQAAGAAEHRSQQRPRRRAHPLSR